LQETKIRKKKTVT